MPEFLGCKCGMVLGPAVIPKPPQNPEHTEDSSSQKSCVPTVAQRHPWHDGGGKDRANIRPGVEDARSQRPFALREPFGNSLDRGGESAGFVQAREQTPNPQIPHQARQSVAPNGETPT